MAHAGASGGNIRARTRQGYGGFISNPGRFDFYVQVGFSRLTQHAADLSRIFGHLDGIVAAQPDGLVRIARKSQRPVIRFSDACVRQLVILTEEA